MRYNKKRIKKSQCKEQDRTFLTDMFSESSRTV